MIVVVIANPQTGQASLNIEGGDPEQAYDLMYNMVDHLGSQLGKPPLKKRSNLIVPVSTAIGAQPKLPKTTKGATLT